MTIVNQMIAAGELRAFVNDMGERERERARWEYYLHRVFKVSYAEWLAQIEADGEEQRHRAADAGMTQEQIVEQTMRIASMSRGEV